MNKGNAQSKLAKLVLVATLSTTLLTGVSYAGNQLKQDSTVAHKQFEVHPTHRIEPKYPVGSTVVVRATAVKQPRLHALHFRPLHVP